MNKKLIRNIITMIDTGACIESIIKDLPQYNSEEIKSCVGEMLKLKVFEDRGGAYIVCIHKHPLVKEIYYDS